MTKPALWIGAAAIAAYLSFATFEEPDRPYLQPEQDRKPAPDFTLKDSAGAATKLSDYRGQVVLLNFWASWCAPCQEELPSLLSMQARMRSKGVTVLGISVDEDDGAYHRFLKERGVNFLTVRDPEQKISGQYGTFGWPETYVIDRKGIVRRKLIGPVDWNSLEISQFLNAM